MAKKNSSSDLGLAGLLAVLVVLGLAITYWQIALAAAVCVGGAGWWWWSRRSAVTTAPASPTSRTLPAIPEPAVPPQLPTRPAVERSERAYASELCPYCRQQMNPVPKAKSRCKSCGQTVYVRTGPDGMRYLLQDIDLPTMEAEWVRARDEEATELEAAHRAYVQAVLAEAWRLTFEAMPSVRLIDLSDDEEEQKVVGESHYQPALAEVSNLLDGVVRRRDVVAVLVPEPENRHDRNAVRVDVFGRPVGYIPREDAAEVAPVLLALRKQGLFVASQAEIVGGGRGHSGDPLSFGIRLAVVDRYDWPARLQGPVALRTAESPLAAVPNA